MKLTRTAIVVIGIAIVGLFLAGRGQAQSTNEGAIRAVLAAQQKAWNEGNVDAFLEGYWHSSELTFSGSSGVARGFDAVRERYKKSYPDLQTMGKLDFSGLEIRVLDKSANAALVLGRWHLAREKGDVGGVFTLVFQHFPEGWRIIHDHTSVVPPTDGQ